VHVRMWSRVTYVGKQNVVVLVALVALVELVVVQPIAFGVSFLHPQISIVALVSQGSFAKFH